MKKNLFALVAVSLSALVLINGTYAQNSVNTEVMEPQKNFTAAEKGTTSNNHTAVNSAINQKAINAFAKTHKNVSGESWEKTSDGYIAKYTSDGVSNMLYYGNNGSWFGSLKSYFEGNMPAEVRRTVKREYYDYSITYVQEAETSDSEGKPTYIIQLEDKNEIKLIRVYNGEMEVWKEYKKQS